MDWHQWLGRASIIIRKEQTSSPGLYKRAPHCTQSRTMASRFFSPFSSCGLLILFFFSFFVFWFDYGDSHPVFDPHWHPATATWYGSPDGDGSDGKFTYLCPWLPAREASVFVACMSAVRLRSDGWVLASVCGRRRLYRRGLASSGAWRDLQESAAFSPSLDACRVRCG